MKPYWKSSDGEIYHGHVLDVLKALPDESVHMCVTSPPYWGLRDYKLEPQIWYDFPGYGQKDCVHVWGDETIKIQRPQSDFEASQGQFCQHCEAWRGSLGLEPDPGLYLKHMVQIFREVKRVLRADGTLWLNIGDSYAASRSYQVSDNKHPAVGATRHMARSTPPLGYKQKDLIGIPWKLAFALQADGWYLRSDIIWHKPNPMPESCKDRPTKAHEYLFLLTKSAKYFYDCEAIKENSCYPNGPNLPQSIKSPHGQGFTRRSGNLKRKENHREGSTRNKRSVWTIPTESTPEAHFATFPKKLVEPCILSGTSEKGCCAECGASWERVVEKPIPPAEVRTKTKQCDDKMVGTGFELNGIKYGSGQKLQNWLNENPPKTTGWQPTCKCNAKTQPCTVLDPFLGSGKTALVAYKHNRRFIGIELSKPYLDEIAIPRIERETKQRNLF
jgi:DNA modification methylase